MRPPRASASNALASPLRLIGYTLLFISGVGVSATFAYVRAGWSLADSIYMVVLTIYTVGYGEVRPIDTPYLHAVTIATIVLGCTGMIVFTGALVQLFTVLQLRELLGMDRMQSRVEKLSDHIIICGFGRIGVMLAQELAQAGVPLVILERRAEKLAEATAAGHLCLAADATDESALRAAGIERARIVATVLPDDAANVFITLSARSLNPTAQIIARGEAASTETKLRRAGATQVVMPTQIGAERMARLVLYPESGRLEGKSLEQLAHSLDELGFDLERVAVAPDSAVARLSVAEAERRGGGTFLIAGIERDGQAISRPGPAVRLESNDYVLLIIRDGTTEAHVLFTKAGERRIGRMRF